MEDEAAVGAGLVHLDGLADLGPRRAVQAHRAAGDGRPRVAVEHDAAEGPALDDLHVRGRVLSRTHLRRPSTALAVARGRPGAFSNSRL